MKGINTKPSRRLGAFFGVVSMLAFGYLVPSDSVAADIPNSGSVTPSRAADSCNGNGTGSGAFITCSVGGNGKGWSTVPGWIVQRSYTDQPCTDSFGHQSYRGDLVNPSSGGVLLDYCLVAHNNGGADTVDQTTLNIPPPKPTADFSGNFLTGAPVSFSVPELGNYVQNLKLFPNAQVVANPVKIEWNFGDCSTDPSNCKSTDMSPKHIFNSSTPDSTKPDDHSAHVRVTGTWHLYLHPNGAANANVVQDLGVVALTGQIDRPVVPVKSIPVEPQANA